MQYYIIFGLLCLAILKQVNAGWEPEDEICVNKLKLERSEIEPLAEKGLHTLDNDNYNRYSECYWKEYNMLSDDGEILWDNIVDVFKNKLESNALNDVIQECKAQKIHGEHIKETVVLVQNCIVKTAIEKGLISDF